MNDQQQVRERKLAKWRAKHQAELLREQVELENLIPEEEILNDGTIRQTFPNGQVRIIRRES